MVFRQKLREETHREKQAVIFKSSQINKKNLINMKISFHTLYILLINSFQCSWLKYIIEEKV